MMSPSNVVRGQKIDKYLIPISRELRKEVTELNQPYGLSFGEIN